MQVFVIAKVPENVSLDQVFLYVKAEAQKAWEYYVQDQLRSIYYIPDMSGAVLMLEVENLEQAQVLLADLPMVKENVLDCEIIPLQPYRGFEALFSQ